MKTLIKNGTVATASDLFKADVLIEGEKVSLIGTDLASKVTGAVDRTIDATGKYVIPGGIDPHTHLDMPFGGTKSADDFETGTRAAAFGGTTSLVDFAIQPQKGALRQGLDEWHACAQESPQHATKASHGKFRNQGADNWRAKHQSFPRSPALFG